METYRRRNFFTLPKNRQALRRVYNGGQCPTAAPHTITHRQTIAPHRTFVVGTATPRTAAHLRPPPNLRTHHHHHHLRAHVRRAPPTPSIAKISQSIPRITINDPAAFHTTVTAQPRSNADNPILDTLGNALCTRDGTQFGFDIGYMEINNPLAATQNNRNFPGALTLFDPF